MPLNVKQAVYEHLKAQVPIGIYTQGRIYPQTLPERVTLPAIAYTITDSDHVRHFLGGSGLRLTTFQIDCLARSDLVASELAEAVREALDNFGGTIVPAGSTRIDTWLESTADVYIPPVDGEPGYYIVTMIVNAWVGESLTP